MEELKINNYQEFKESVGRELKAAAQSFVRIGYLLRKAKEDRTILEGSGYESVTEFAEKEYGLEHSQVSRFIRINERFSEGGNSDRLMEQYEGMGSAKLTLMLSLPDTITEELTPDYSKADVQAIKEEVEAEAKVTEIERMIEGESDELTPLQQVMMETVKNNPRLYGKLFSAEESEIKELMAPNGEATYSARVQGKGRVMLFCKDEPQLVYIREDIKETVSWEDIWKAIPRKSGDVADSYYFLFGESFLKKLAEQEESKGKVQKATPDEQEPKKQKKEEPKTKEKPVTEPTEANFEEEKAAVEEKPTKTEVENTENPPTEPTETDFMNQPEKEPKNEEETNANPATEPSGSVFDNYECEGQLSIEDCVEKFAMLSSNDRKRVNAQLELMEKSIKALKKNSEDRNKAIYALQDIEWLAKHIRTTLEEANE